MRATFESKLIMIASDSGSERAACLLSSHAILEAIFRGGRFPFEAILEPELQPMEAILEPELPALEAISEARIPNLKRYCTANETDASDIACQSGWHQNHSMRSMKAPCDFGGRVP